MAPLSWEGLPGAGRVEGQGPEGKQGQFGKTANDMETELGTQANPPWRWRW